MANLKEQRICIKFSFRLRKTALEIHKMLKTAFGDNATGRTSDFCGILLSQMLGNLG
jgi:hypothetical protein